MHPRGEEGGTFSKVAKKGMKQRKEESRGREEREQEEKKITEGTKEKVVGDTR